MLDSYNRQQEKKRQEYRLQLQDGITILNGAVYVLLHNLAGMMPGASSTEYLQLQDIFPEIYADSEETKEQEQHDKACVQKLSPEMQLYKAQRLDHAYRMNAERAAKADRERMDNGRNDAGKTEGGV